MQMFRFYAENAMTDGTGNFDKHKFLVEYPEVLKLNNKKAREVVEEISTEKIRPTLVQAISLYRQNKSSEMVNTLLNLVSQYRAFPTSLTWEDESEIEDIYKEYMRWSSSRESFQDVSQAIGLSNDRSKNLMKTIDLQKPEGENNSRKMNDLSYFN